MKRLPPLLRPAAVRRPRKGAMTMEGSGRPLQPREGGRRRWRRWCTACVSLRRRRRRALALEEETSADRSSTPSAVRQMKSHCCSEKIKAKWAKGSALLLVPLSRRLRGGRALLAQSAARVSTVSACRVVAEKRAARVTQLWVIHSALSGGVSERPRNTSLSPLRVLQGCG